MLNSNHIKENCAFTSFGQHRWQVFKYKIFSNKLLTLIQLKLQKPDLYNSDTCILYHSHFEIQSYLWFCITLYKLHIQAFESSTTLLYHSLLTLKSNTFFNLSNIVILIHKLRGFIYIGVVPLQLSEYVQQFTHFISVTECLIVEFFNFLYYELFTTIWKLWYHKVIIFKQSQDISYQRKKSHLPINFSSFFPSIIWWFLPFVLLRHYWRYQLIHY